MSRTFRSFISAPRLSHLPRRAMHVLSVLAVTCTLLLAGCGGSKITEANYDKVKPGMTQDEVEKILGKGTDQTANATAFTGVPAKSTIFVYSDKEGEKSITVFYVQGKVAQKTQSGI